MPAPDRPRGRRRSAKTTVDFATGEVHDRLVDAAESPETVALEQLSAEEREAARIGRPPNAPGSRPVRKTGRQRRARPRKIP